MNPRTSPDAAVNWMLKATIVLASVPVALAFAVPTPILAKMSDQLGNDPTTDYLVKMVLGILGVAMAIGAPIAGFLADKLGRRPILVASGLLFTLAGAAPFVVDSLPVILATRFVVGIAAAAFATVGAAMIGDLFEDRDRARWTGLLLAGSMVASLIAAPLSGVLGDSGWRWPFALYLAGLPITALAWLGLRRTRGGARPATAAAPAATTSAAPVAIDGRFPLGLLLFGLLVGMLMYVPAVYVPFQLRQLGLESPSMIAVGITINLVIGALLAGQFGRARERWSARALFCWSFGGTGLGVLILASAPTWQWAFFGLFVMGVGSIWLYPNMLSLVIAAVSDDHRGQAVGWLRSAQSIAPAIGLTLLEPVVARLGVATGLLVVAGLAACLFATVAARVAPFNRIPAGAA